MKSKNMQILDDYNELIETYNKLLKDHVKAKKNIKDLIKCIESCLKAIDIEMAKPSTEERGKRIATICNHLEMQKDLVKLSCGFIKIHGS